MPAAIIDTGPLVAFFDRAERHHRWALAQVESLEAPLLVCEPVLAETMYLLGAMTGTEDAVLELVQNGALSIAFRVQDEAPALRRLLRKYRDRPMSFADACIVRMAELHDRHAVLTLDSDFAVYRKHGRMPMTLLHPGGHA
jgi:predicted nucleic acid-binding protein